MKVGDARHTTQGSKPQVPVPLEGAKNLPRCQRCELPRQNKAIVTKHVFLIPYAIIFGTFKGLQRAWTTPFYVPLGGQNKNFQWASLTFPYGSRSFHPSLGFTTAECDCSHLVEWSCSHPRKLWSPCMVQRQRSSLHETLWWRSSVMSTTAHWEPAWFWDFHRSTCQDEKHSLNHHRTLPHSHSRRSQGRTHGQGWSQWSWGVGKVCLVLLWSIYKYPHPWDTLEGSKVTSHGQRGCSRPLMLGRLGRNRIFKQNR